MESESPEKKLSPNTTKEPSLKKYLTVEDLTKQEVILQKETGLVFMNSEKPIIEKIRIAPISTMTWTS